MAEAHEWTLRRLREMAGRLTEQAYLRASEAAAAKDDEAQARWMLVFDRMARGLRLSMALEARLARERRWDADEALREARGERHAPRWRRPAAASAAARDERAAEAGERLVETDVEADCDGLPEDAPLAQRIGRLKAINEGAGAPEPPTPLRGAERRALEAQRLRRAGLAGSDRVPDEPWDVLDEATSLDDLAPDPPWRGAG